MLVRGAKRAPALVDYASNSGRHPELSAERLRAQRAKIILPIIVRGRARRASVRPRPFGATIGVPAAEGVQFGSPSTLIGIALFLGEARLGKADSGYPRYFSKLSRF